MIEKLDVKDGLVDITDPCYDRGTWCAMWGVKVKTGEYTVEINKTGSRVRSIYMHLPDEKMIRKQDIGLAGVDAGLCGFFIDKPTFSDDEWMKICKDIEEQEKSGKDIFKIASGVFSSSGYGDGEYPISAYYNGDLEIVGLKITFIEKKVD